MKLRFAIATLALLAAACSPPAPSVPASPAPPEAPSAAAETEALLAALTPVIEQDVGQSGVSFTIDTVNVDNDWAWLVVQPQGVDWSRTKYATQAAEGLLDGDGTTYALLRRELGQWRVLDFVVGPTDVAYADWPQRHSAPPELMGLPPE
jgi:hypothetical protein